MNEKDILDELICQYTCIDIGEPFVPKKFDSTHAKVDYFMKNLPALSYVQTQSLNYIFSNGLTSSTQDETKKLKEFLYRENLYKTTNYMAIRSAISSCMVYGEAGLRWYKDNLYVYESGKFAIISSIVDGVKVILGYVIDKDGRNVNDIKITSEEEFQQVVTHPNNIFLTQDDFCLIRTDTNKLHGLCPFETDTLRLELLCEVYEKLLYDIRYDGPGRIIIRPRTDVTSEDRSTADILTQSKPVQDYINSEAKKEVERVAKELKNSRTDSVIALSHGFDDKITHLPRVTKSTEFLNWLMKEEGVIVAEKLGMRPTILGLDDIAGNVSQEKIIDDTMLNSIVPIRELYSNQFSKFLADHLGISKVYFDKYELQQSPKDYDIRQKYAETIRNLSNSVANLQKGEGNEVAIATLDNAIDNLGTIMNESLFIDDNDLLKEM